MGNQPKPQVAWRLRRLILAAAAIAIALLLGAQRAAAAPDLSLAARDTPDPVTVGDRLTYLLILSNAGAEPALATTLRVSLPQSSDVISASASRGGCTAARTTACALGALEPGASAGVSVSVRPTAPGRITMSAQAISTGPAIASLTTNSVNIETDVHLKPDECANPRIGTPLDDVLNGTAGGDWIFGYGGKDVLRGKGGDDCLDGAGGADRLDGGLGGDVVAGRSGRDRLAGRGGDDFLFGGSAPDVLSGGSGSDQLVGDAGTDRLVGGHSSDSLYGGSGRDRLRAGSGADELFGGAGADQLLGGAGEDFLGGGRGRDRASGGAGSDAIFAAERVDGGTGNDEIYVRPGAVVHCGAGNDTLWLAGRPRLAGEGDCEGVVYNARDRFPNDSTPESLECLSPPSSCGRSEAHPGVGGVRRPPKRHRLRGKCRRRRCRPLVVQQRVERGVDAPGKPAL